MIMMTRAIACAAVIALAGAVAHADDMFRGAVTVEGAASAETIFAERIAFDTLSPSVMRMEPGDRVTLNFGAGHQAELDRVVVNETGSRAWVGRIAGHGLESRIIITDTNGVLFGRVHAPDGLWLIIPSRAGGHEIFRHNDLATREPWGDDQIVPDIDTVLDLHEQLDRPQVDISGADVETGSLGTVDIAVFYTASVVETWGLATAGRIQYLTTLLDQALVDSDTGVRARLVHTGLVEASETASNALTLADLKAGAGDGVAGPNGQDFSALLAIRNAKGADLVALIRNFRRPEHGSCGVAYVLGGGSGVIGAGAAPFGVSVNGDWIDANDDNLADGYRLCSDITFAHETGHNLGLVHDAANSTPGSGVRSFAHGYRVNCAFTTIMAYDSTNNSVSCPGGGAPGAGNEASTLHFSNPDIDTCPDGATCGTASADAARAIREEGRNVQFFRAEAGNLRSAVLPLTRAVGNGQPATAFATVINPAGNDSTATGCGLRVAGATAEQFSYQTTTSSNALTGSANTTVDIPSGASQNFIFSLTSATTFVDNAVTPVSSNNNETAIFVEAFCSNRRSAEYVNGVNSFTFLSEAFPGADIVAVAGTPSIPGVVEVPLTGNQVGFFVVAVTNLGAGAIVNATPLIGASASAEIQQVEICRTNAETGACETDRASTTTASLPFNGTATFAVFIRGTGEEIANIPATNRVFVRFTTAGSERGATSVAVRTPAP